MLSDDELNQYVTNVLKDRANKQAAAYSRLGFRAFLQNAAKDGPLAKPNTQFLKNIVREVDGHNRALTRKEEKEARERLKELSKRDVEKLYGYKEKRTHSQDDRFRRRRGRSKSPRRHYHSDREEQKKHRCSESLSDEGRKERRHRSSG
jgi:hypothetical protein